MISVFVRYKMVVVDYVNFYILIMGIKVEEIRDIFLWLFLFFWRGRSGDVMDFFEK